MSDSFQRLLKRNELPCREDPELFFDAEDYQGAPNEHTDYAKSLCRRCPIRYECLYEALENDERFGIWGGATTSERQQFKSKTQSLGSIAA